MKHTPTAQLYRTLEIAYDFFNSELFDSKLPGVILTVQRKAGVMGYFVGDRWSDSAGNYCSEISINPAYIGQSRLIEVMQTLVHEMVHCWQHFHGKPSRKAYHNKEWAFKMIEVGLMPSNTGVQGGAITGQFMGDYILEDGPFIKAVSNLVNDAQFQLSWVDRKALPRLYEPLIAKPPIDVPDSKISNELVNEPIATSLISNTERQEAATESAAIVLSPLFTAQKLLNDSFVIHESAPQRTRDRYQCPGCGVIVYGKSSIHLICGDCRLDFKTSN